MTRLEERLIRACEAFGIKIDLGFRLQCPDGHEVKSIARIRDLGAPNGMLVISSFDEVKKHQECVEAAGFGYSVLDEPGDKSTFDLQVYKEIFCDWGWRDGDCPELVEEIETE
jgi:hypothetical protein